MTEATRNILVSSFACPRSGERIQAAYDASAHVLSLRAACAGTGREPNPDALEFMAAFEGRWGCCPEVVRALELAGVDRPTFRHASPADHHHVREALAVLSHRVIDAVARRGGTLHGKSPSDPPSPHG